MSNTDPDEFLEVTNVTLEQGTSLPLSDARGNIGEWLTLLRTDTTPGVNILLDYLNELLIQLNGQREIDPVALKVLLQKMGNQVQQMADAIPDNAEERPKRRKTRMSKLAHELLNYI